MLIAGLNYNSNLGLGVRVSDGERGARHHASLQPQYAAACRSMRPARADAFAGARRAMFEFVLRNDSQRRAPRRRGPLPGGLGARAASPARSSESLARSRVPVGAARRHRIEQFELRTRYPFGWFHAWTYVQARSRPTSHPAPRGNRTLPCGGRQRARLAIAKRAATRISRACAPTSRACRSSTWPGRCWRAAASPRCAATASSGGAAGVAGMVRARRTRHRGAPVAAVPVGAGERRRTAHLRPADSRAGRFAPGARRRASVRVPAGARAARGMKSHETPDVRSHEQSRSGSAACLALAARRASSARCRCGCWVTVARIAAAIRLRLRRRGRRPAARHSAGDRRARRSPCCSCSSAPSTAWPPARRCSH